MDNLFLMLLDRLTKQGRPVSDKAKANAYAPGAFAREPEAKADNVTKQELAAAMDRLFRADRIHSTAYGRRPEGGPNWSKPRTAPAPHTQNCTAPAPQGVCPVPL